MKAGEIVVSVFKVIDSADAVVTGLIGGDFTVTAYAAGVIATLTSTITELGTGYYKWQYTAPITPVERLEVFIDPPSGNYLQWADTSISLTRYDEDDIYAAALVPKSAGANAVPGEVSISYIAGDTRPITFAITGVPLLSDYTAFGLGVRSIDGTTSVDEISTGITVDDDGNVSVAISGSENFHTFIANGQPSVGMRFDFQCVKASDSKIYTFARGPFTILRQEYRA